MSENTEGLIRVTLSGKPPAPGFENASAPQPLKPNGQHADYWVLSKAERDKGFVRPVRQSYRHVGERPKYPLRDLTPEERAEYASERYVKFEPYPVEKAPSLGRFWTQAQLDSGCGAVTSMSMPLAETYARNPRFYGSTFCCHCGGHFPVSEFCWLNDVTGPVDEVLGS